MMLVLRRAVNSGSALLGQQRATLSLLAAPRRAGLRRALLPPAAAAANVRTFAKKSLTASSSKISSVRGGAAGADRLKLALAQIESQFGKGSIFQLGDKSNVLAGVETVSTGSLSLDAALGIGGLPKGRVVEIYGPESSGKTTLALHCLAQAQAAGGTCAFVDAEHALDPKYAAALGVDVDHLLVTQPDSGEQALEITDKLVLSGGIDVVVVDSVAALVPQKELEGDMGDHHVALQARLMSQAMRKLTGSLARSNTLLIFINQLRSKVGVIFGSPEVTAGGNALRYYSSVRLDIRRVRAIKGAGAQSGELVGTEMRVKVVKNKMAPPFQEAHFDMMFGLGIDREGELLDAAVEHEIARKAGAWFAFTEEGAERVAGAAEALEASGAAAGNLNFGQGREKAKAFLREHPAVADSLEEKLRAIIFPKAADEKEEDAAPAPAPGAAAFETTLSAEDEAAQAAALQQGDGGSLGGGAFGA